MLNGNIKNNNKKEIYKKRLDGVENDLTKSKKSKNFNQLKDYLTKIKYLTGTKYQKGKRYVDLPILLSKLNINSSKELISNVKQPVKNLYDNKQITKQVCNILNEAITYKILDDKIKANERQYDLDRMNAEISAYSSDDLPKYEYLTEKDLGYKPDAVEKVKFEYSPIGKVFTDRLAKEDKSKKFGLFKRLKNIKDNLVEVDDNGNKVGIFRIIKDIKDRGIKIDNDDEAVREIRKRIK